MKHFAMVEFSALYIAAAQVVESRKNPTLSHSRGIAGNPDLLRALL
jgi:hypothetical protein